MFFPFLIQYLLRLPHLGLPLTSSDLFCPSLLHIFSNSYNTFASVTLSLRNCVIKTQQIGEVVKLENHIMSLGFRQPGNPWGEVSVTPSEMTKCLPGKGLCFPTTRLPRTRSFRAMTGAVSWKRWLWALPASEQASAITPSWLNLFQHRPLTQWPNSFWSKSQLSCRFIHKYPILSLKHKDSFPGNYTSLITPKLCAIITANIIKYLSVLTFLCVSHLNQDANKVHTLWLVRVSLTLLGSHLEQFFIFYHSLNA